MFRYLPDKAIDLVDEAASRVKMEVSLKPEVGQEYHGWSLLFFTQQLMPGCILSVHCITASDLGALFVNCLHCSCWTAWRGASQRWRRSAGFCGVGRSTARRRLLLLRVRGPGSFGREGRQMFRVGGWVGGCNLRPRMHGQGGLRVDGRRLDHARAWPPKRWRLTSSCAELEAELEGLKKQRSEMFEKYEVEKSETSELLAIQEEIDRWDVCTIS